jgi:hypothetical protein
MVNWMQMVLNTSTFLEDYREKRTRSIKWSEATKGRRLSPLFISWQHNIKESTSLCWKKQEHREKKSWPCWSLANSRWSLCIFPAKSPAVLCLYIQHLSAQTEVSTPLRKGKKTFPQIISTSNIILLSYVHYLTST